MSAVDSHIAEILARKAQASLNIETLGYFQVERNGKPIPDTEWKRDIAIQLFQFFITIRNQRALHKAQIIYRLWREVNDEAGNRNFKAALHSFTKVIEPDKAGRSASKYIIRQGQTYRLDKVNIWMDVDALDELIVLGNQFLNDEPEMAAKAYRAAISHYQGIYLPNRIYEDWSAEERERIQVLVLGAMMTLAKLMLEKNPSESIRLAKQTLTIDSTWEEAYRIQMEAYMAAGNRPLALKAYQKCQEVLKAEFEIDPLPETKILFRRISTLS